MAYRKIKSLEAVADPVLWDLIRQQQRTVRLLARDHPRDVRLNNAVKLLDDYLAEARMRGVQMRLVD